MSSNWPDAMKRWFVVLLIGMPLLLTHCGHGDHTPEFDFPFYEDFEGTDDAFVFEQGSGWGVAASHGERSSFSGKRHLDNRIPVLDQKTASNPPVDDSVLLARQIRIPNRSKGPHLSFWVKSQLLKKGDAVHVEIHYEENLKTIVDTVLTLGREDNTSPFYTWRQISLSKYKGKRIKVGFRQSFSDAGKERVFAVDNLSIGDGPSLDTDKDGIPDSLDYAPHGDRLPPLADFSAEDVDGAKVRLSWAAPSSGLPVAGYRLYRRKAGSFCDVLVNDQGLIPVETTEYMDGIHRQTSSPSYRIVAVSSDGYDGAFAWTGGDGEAAMVAPFPYEEGFDGAESRFAFPDGSGWSVAEAHGVWGNISGNYHLDSNPLEEDQVVTPGSRYRLRATMKERVHIPDHAARPILSYWYKMNLKSMGVDDFPSDGFWNPLEDLDFLRGLMFGDAVFIDIHYIWRPSFGGSFELVDRYRRTLRPGDNTNDYVWDAVSLEKYRGTEVWVDFRKQTGCTGRGSVFVLDDFRISETPLLDANGNGVPDDFEVPTGGTKLPYVKDFKAGVSKDTVRLTWVPGSSEPSLHPAGYSVYRKKEGQTSFEKLTDSPLPYEASEWVDANVGQGSYFYYVVAVSTEGVEGYPTQVVSVDVQTVTLPPVVIVQPTAQEAVEFTSATFALEAQGVRLSYQWKRNRVPIEGAISPSYTRLNVALEDHGAEFSCVVSNAGGGVESDSARLTVHQAPPVIGTHPENLRVNANSNATISVSVTGSQLQYQWYKGTTIIPGATSRELTFRSVTPGDSGTYHCIVKNDAGSVSSQPADLIVAIDQKPEIALKGPDVRATNDFMTSLSGYVLAPGTTVGSVTAVNDRYPGHSFGITLDANGAIIGEVPLELGLNTITLTMVMADGTIVTKVITVTAGTASLPVISIVSPANGATVTTESVTLSGLIRSSLPPEQIRVVHGEQLIFPSGSGGEYDFSFDHDGLVKGHNTLRVLVETPFGNVSAQSVIIYADEEPSIVSTPPVIEVYAPLPGRMVTEESVAVKGVARGERAIASVEVNGTPATLTGNGTQISFEALIDVAAGEAVAIHITATDITGESGELTYEVGRDATPPVIAITTKALLSAETPLHVVENPLPVTGRITEANLAGVAIEVRTLQGEVRNRIQPTIAPAAGDHFDFSQDVILPGSGGTLLFIEAWDMAGNRTDRSFVLAHEGGVAIEVISPVDGSRKTVSGGMLELPVTLRMPGIQASDQVVVSLDGIPQTGLTRSGATLNGTITANPTEGTRDVAVVVKGADGTPLAQTHVSFDVVDLDKTPLKVIRQEPANNAEGVEPNDFIAFYFNKEADPAKLSVEVYESVHGKVWSQPVKGADITEISTVTMEEIHRSNERVPGGVSVLPGNTMVAFYPERDFGYTATVTVKLLYGEKELSRTLFTVRPRPTFIKGMVISQFTDPLDGLKITVPELGLAAVSSDGGNFGFGFGDKAGGAIPPGKYRLLVNPGMANPEFGTVERWVNVQGGMLNQLSAIKVPVLNPDEPFRLIESGRADNLLAGGELNLNLNAATLYFPDGMNRGSVHTQFTTVDKVGCNLSAAAVPHWVFAVQPMGIEVRGTVGLDIKMPKLYGTLDYVENLGERVVLVGYDPDAMQLVPVGVGHVNKEQKRVVSERPVSVNRLDYLGYAVVDEEKQSLLKEYAEGAISMVQLTFELQAL